MVVVNCNQPTFFDIDDTLVKWDASQEEQEKYGIAITCPVVTTESGNSHEWTEYLVPHKRHIKQLKLHKSRGHTIIVWSQGGSAWAHAVVKALELEKYVDLIIEKPMWLYDDLEPSFFLPRRIYLEDK